MLTLLTLITLTQAFGHENKLLPSSRMRIQSRCGTITGPFRISRYFIGVDVLDANLTNVLQPFTMRFPRADIHELLTPDLLHQVIKGTFKDHLVQWIEDYLKLVYGPSKAETILDEIDRQYVESHVF